MRALILTDHTKHSSENSLYTLASTLVAHEYVAQVDVASRKLDINSPFFSGVSSAPLWVTEIDQLFKYSEYNHPLDHHSKPADIASYDFIWLRMPPPLSETFLHYVSERFKGKVIINNPSSIYETGSKAFLLNFKEVCPPMQLCHSGDEIIHFSRQFPIVLKPLREYGGKGIVKIESDYAYAGKLKMSLVEFIAQHERHPIEYLAVKYLQNVTKGDKRIIVIDGEILGASLRLPADNSWLCNVAMGGSSNITQVEKEEEEIIRLINPTLSDKGIVMYGVDTLVGDDGKRVLSEINTTSIGGLPQIAAMNNLPLVERAIDLIWAFYNDKKKRNG